MAQFDEAETRPPQGRADPEPNKAASPADAEGPRQRDEADKAETKKPFTLKKPWVKVLLIIAVLVGGGIWGFRYWTVARFIQETNNARIEADQVTVSPQISGYVSSPPVSANQVVAAGQILLTIDDSEAQARLTEQQALVDVRQADVARAKTELSRQQAQIDRCLNQIAVLVSREPGAVDAALRQLRDVPMPSRVVAIDDSGTIIRRRPDIRRAERQLAAANAQIGQSVVRLFPRVNLIGNAGWVSPNIGSVAASTYNLGPTLSWSILDFGRTLAQIRQFEAGTDEALAQYEQTVLQAMQDTETSLSRYGNQRTAVARLTRASVSARKASMLTDQRNTAGTISTIDVLDIERQRLQAEQSLAQAQAEYTNNYVALQKSLGFGWGLLTERVALVQR